MPGMTEFDDLKNIWNRQERKDIPDVAVIISKAGQEKWNISKKILLQVATLLMAVGGVIWVFVAIEFKMITTYIGIFMIVAVIVAFSAIRLYQVFKLKNINLADAPKNVLLQLESFYAFQQFVATKCMFMYFVLLSVAMGLYFIEVMAPMSLMLKIVVLIIYVGWMLISYFVIGKKQKAKEYARTEAIINLIRKMERDFD